ncbi:MAG: NADH-quinone oxidoreductase subunit J [Firmicutes bacterium]|nr:NADH-quinone oxidoreductase subunit J [Bacillota bacterium]
MSGAWLAFAALTGMVLYSGYKVVTSPLITHAALYLATALVGVAGFFLMLESEFLAVVQVLVYVGAVMTVIIFAIMLSDVPALQGDPQATLVSRLLSRRFGSVPALVSAGVLALVLIGYGSVRWAAAPLGGAPEAVHPLLHDTTAQGSTGVIGRALFTTYLVPFEVASLLLLAAMVGAIVLTRRERGAAEKAAAGKAGAGAAAAAPAVEGAAEERGGAQFWP